MRTSRKQQGALVMSMLLAAAAALLLAIGVTACDELTTSSSAETTIPPETTVVTPSSDEPTTTLPAAPETTTTTAGSALSQESLDYALWLGGTDHYGETLHFVIGASVRTEAQAKALLEPAKAVGDMQSSFIVQLSDNFDGMRAGYWVVFEAYDGYPSEEDLFFCRRPFPDAYVKSATVMTHDPIPVRPGG